MMVRFAILDETRTRVVNVVLAAGDFGLQRGWIPCAEAVASGWTFSDGVLLAPVQDPAMVPAAADLRAAGIAALDRLSRMVTSAYPEAEVATWSIKDREARSVIAGADPATTTVVGPLAAALGVPAAQVATVIVAKANAFTALALWIETRRSAFDAALAAAGNAAAREAALQALEEDIAAKAAEIHASL